MNPEQKPQPAKFAEVREIVRSTAHATVLKKLGPRSAVVQIDDCDFLDEYGIVYVDAALQTIPAQANVDLLEGIEKPQNDREWRDLSHKVNVTIKSLHTTLSLWNRLTQGGGVHCVDTLLVERIDRLAILMESLMDELGGEFLCLAAGAEADRLLADGADRNTPAAGVSRG